jgi:hypothetical protein
MSRYKSSIEKVGKRFGKLLALELVPEAFPHSH